MDVFRKGFFAPLSNFSNAPMRYMTKLHGADYTIVPLISATALARKPKDMILRVDFNPKFDDGVQLFGSVPEDFRSATKVLLDYFPELKWIDVNCGCPSYIVREAGAGSALLDKPDLLEDILRVLKGLPEVLTIKVRLLDNPMKTLPFLKRFERYVDFITVHGRTVKQGYSGVANWEIIREIHEGLDVPLVGNGDLRSNEDGLARVEGGYSDGFMIGRFALDNPWSFENRFPSSEADSREMFCEYFRIADRLNMLDVVDLRLKALKFFRFFPNSAKLRGAIAKFKTIEEFEDLIINCG